MKKARAARGRAPKAKAPRPKRTRAARAVVRKPRIAGTGSHSKLPPLAIWGGALRSSLVPINQRHRPPKSVRGKKKRAAWTAQRDRDVAVRVYALVVVFKDEYDDQAKPDRIEIDTVLVGAAMTIDEARAMPPERIFARVTHPGSHPIEILALVAGRSFEELRAIDDATRSKRERRAWLHTKKDARKRKWWTVPTDPEEEGDDDARQDRARAAFRRIRARRRKAKKSRRPR